MNKQMTEEEAFEWMFELDVVAALAENRQLYAIVQKDIVREDTDPSCGWPGKSYKKGTKVKVFVTSRMGDFCIGGNLKAENGYTTRGIEPGQGFLGEFEKLINCKKVKEE